jgi:hypothetical protein
LKGSGDFPTMCSLLVPPPPPPLLPPLLIPDPCVPHSSAESVISLCWLRPTLIAAGGDRGIVSIFDVRSLSEPPLTVMAHSARVSKKVKGIRCSPFDENVVATFSDLAGEPVKVLPPSSFFLPHPPDSFPPSDLGHAEAGSVQGGSSLHSLSSRSHLGSSRAHRLSGPSCPCPAPPPSLSSADHSLPCSQLSLP